MRYHLAVGRQVRLFSFARRELLYDTDFVPPRRGSAVKDTITYILLRGAVVWRNPEQYFEAPCVLRFSSKLFDGGEGERPRSYCCYGDPAEGIILFSSNRTTKDAPILPEVEHVLGEEAILASARSYHALAFRDAPVSELRPVAGEIMTACVDRGVLLPGTESAFETRWSPLVAMTFSALHQTWRTASMLPTLSDLAHVVGRSDRQLARNIGALATAFAAPGLRFRSATLDWRMREAITFLSAPQATVTQVAKAVRYGSVEAMARAFRDAGLPAPVEVRAAMRRVVDELEARSAKS